MSKHPSKTSVIIIGAGASGLYAAALLQQENYDVVVLEARDRIGGRLLSVPVDGGRVDLGATWFWSNEPLITGLIADAAMPAFTQHIAGDMLFQQAPGPAQRMQGNQLNTPSGRLANGMQAVPDVLAANIAEGTIRLEHVVSSITIEAGEAVVRTATETLTAPHVILAIPPALAMASIDFGGQMPDLVAGLAGATPVWMGATVKVVATFERAFWRDEGLAGTAFSYAGPMREIHDMSGPDGTPAAIFGFCGIPAGDAAPTQDEILTQLADLYGPTAPKPTKVHIMDWRAEQFTSPSNVELLTSYETYGHRQFQTPTLDGHLHWASTETSPVAPGHIEGALTGARRAVQAITSATRPIEESTP